MYKLYTEIRNVQLDSVDCNVEDFESFAPARQKAMSEARREEVQKAVVNDAEGELVFDAIDDKHRVETLNDEVQRRIEASTRLAQARAREARQVDFYADGDSDRDIALVLSTDFVNEWLEYGTFPGDIADIRDHLEELVRREWIVTQEYRLTVTRRVTASSEDEAREIAEEEDAIYRIDLSDGWEEEDCYHEDTTVEEDY